MHPRFLAAIDFSECSFKALTLAAQYARQYNGALHVLHAIFYPGNALGHERQDIFWENATETANAKLAEAIADYAKGIENIQVHLVEGRPQDSVMEFADVLEADIVFIGAHGFRLDGDPFIGSEALHLLRQHRRPLMIVSQLPVARSGPAHVLVPVSRRYGVKGLAYFLRSNRFGFQSELELLHLVEEGEENPSAAHFLERKVAELKEAGATQVESGLVTCNSDDIAAGILRHLQASERPFDLICVESRDTAAMGEMLVGSTLEDIILNCKRPVLCLNPESNSPEPQAEENA